MADMHGTRMEGSAAAEGPSVEIFCDESGSEGEKLVGGTTDVFAHASVRIGIDAAAACIKQVRLGARSPATEVKASVVLRDRNRGVLEWLLGPLGPLHGQAHVHLTEKSFHVVRRVATLLDEPSEQVGDAEAAGDGAGATVSAHGAGADRVSATALVLYREGPQAFGAGPWQQLLAAFNDLMRSKHRAEAWLSAEAFFGQVDVLRGTQVDGVAGRLVRRIADLRPDSHLALHAMLAGLRGSGGLDPLIPALAAAVAYWADGGRQVSIVHDVQGALTAARIALVKELSGGVESAGLNGHGDAVERAGTGNPLPASLVGSRLAGIRFVDSQTDPRVQVADFLAGAARRIASDQLNGRGDPELTALLRPYVDADSIWGDQVSWRNVAAPGSH